MRVENIRILQISLILALTVVDIMAMAQKPALDFSAIEHWPSVQNFRQSLSDNGEFCSYSIQNVPTGSSTLVVQSIREQWRKKFINANNETCVFANDNKHFIFQGYGDTLSIVELGSDNITKIEHVQSWYLSSEGSLVFRKHTDKDQLIIYSLVNKSERTINNVHECLLNHKGNILVLYATDDADQSSVVELFDLQSDKRTKIWRGIKETQEASNFGFSKDDDKLFFFDIKKTDLLTYKSLWFYKIGMDSAISLIDTDDVRHYDSNLKLSDRNPIFDKTGEHIFLYLSKPELPPPPATTKGLDVYNYKDVLLPAVEKTLTRPSEFLTVINIKDNLEKKNKFVCLESDSLTVILNHDFYEGMFSGTHIVAEEFMGTNWRYRIRKDSLPVVYRISIADGSKERINIATKYTDAQVSNYFSISPEGKFLLWFSVSLKAYFSCNLEDGKIKNITRQIPALMLDNKFREGKTLPSIRPVELGPWLTNDSSLMIYDNNDIWEVDPCNKHKPINITNSYGKLHHLRFAIVPYGTGDDNIIDRDKDLLLSAFDTENKYNGFYKITHPLNKDPEMLSMGPYMTYLHSNQIYFGELTEMRPYKARSAELWLTGRISPTDPFNLFITRDFKTFESVSDIQPQKRNNWLTKELVKYTMTNGERSEGVLYKPENFDPQKKYPIIFTFYNRQSDALYYFPKPGLSRAIIDIAFYVSKGYLVFEPDIYYEINEVGKSVARSVLSAVSYLTQKYSWIDTKRMGVSGQSFGGYEVNYLITHSHLFAAAEECCGLADLVSDYGNILDKKFLYGVGGYFKMSTTFWKKPGVWIENSPVFKADKITTPLLILHNHGDMGVVFGQGAELYTALWQLKKPAWLLQYDDGGHGVRTKDALDFTIRLSQFFDHYLMNKPAPRWMVTGIPPEKKGIDNGLELDNSGNKP